MPRIETSLALAPRTGLLPSAVQGLAAAKAQFTLELRKHRLMFGGLAATFLASIPLAAVSGLAYGIPTGAAVDGMLSLWTFAGLPLTAAIYGATAGAELRTAGAEEAEAPLPVPVLSRLRGALAGAASGFLVILALVMGAWLIRVQSPGSATSTALAAGGPFSAALGITILTASFVVGYASRHAVLAGLTGLSIGLITHVPAGAAALVCWGFSDRLELGVSGWSLLAALALGSPAAILAAGRIVLPRLARAARVAAASWAAAAVLLAAQLAPASFMFASSLERLNSSRREVSAKWGVPPADEAAAFAAIPGRLDGRFITTFDGGLYFQPTAGPEVPLAPRYPLSPLALWRQTYQARFTQVGWGWDGRIWALKTLEREGRIIQEVYVAQGAAPLRLVAVCPDSCDTDGLWSQVAVSRVKGFPPLLFSNYLPQVLPYTGPNKSADIMSSAYGASLELKP